MGEELDDANGKVWGGAVWFVKEEGTEVETPG
jgi:hypothetical protein